MCKCGIFGKSKFPHCGWDFNHFWKNVGFEFRTPTIIPRGLWDFSIMWVFFRHFLFFCLKPRFCLKESFEIIIIRPILGSSLGGIQKCIIFCLFCLQKYIFSCGILAFFEIMWDFFPPKSHRGMWVGFFVWDVWFRTFRIIFFLFKNYSWSFIWW